MIVNIDEEYKQLLGKKGFALPSAYLKKEKDGNDAIAKVKEKLYYINQYIQDHTTKKGEPLANYQKGKKL